MATKKLTTKEALGITAPQGTPEGMIVIRPIELKRAIIRVTGSSLLCTHPFSEKAKKMMLDKMQGIKEKNPPKNPQEEYEASIYRNASGEACVKAIAFKAAAVDAATQFDKSLTKVFLRGVFHVTAEYLPVEGTPEMREDVVRVGMGSADLRYRAQFWPWQVDVPVRYVSRNISLASLVELFNMAGFACGIHEYRPQKNGNWGMFEVENVTEMPDVPIIGGKLPPILPETGASNVL